MPDLSLAAVGAKMISGGRGEPQADDDYGHLGFAMDSRAEVDAKAQDWLDAGCTQLIHAMMKTDNHSSTMSDPLARPMREYALLRWEDSR